MQPAPNDRIDELREKIMNLTTAQMQCQDGIAHVTVETEKIKEDLEEIEQYLRGSTDNQHHSFETRITMVERGVALSGEYERATARRFRSIETMVAEIRQDIQSIKLGMALEDKADAKQEKAAATRYERFKDWMKLWGWVLAFAGTIATAAFENLDKITDVFKKDPRPPMVVAQADIEAARKKRGGPKKIHKEMQEKYGPNVDEP